MREERKAKRIFLIVPCGVGEALAESGRKGRGLVGGVEVRGVAQSGGAERGYALSALLGVDRGDRRGGEAGMLPEDVGRGIHKMRQKHGGKTEMAGDNYRVVIGSLRKIALAAPLVAV